MSTIETRCRWFRQWLESKEERERLMIGEKEVCCFYLLRSLCAVKVVEIVPSCFSEVLLPSDTNEGRERQINVPVSTGANRR